MTTTPATHGALDRRFIVQRDGKEFILFAGLLDLAHQQGLTSITTALLQAPSDSNGQTAICHATVTTAKGTFSGIGDAAPNNTRMKTALIRMAETWAKARALRDAVNASMVALEEVDADDSGIASVPAAGATNFDGVLTRRLDAVAKATDKTRAELLGWIEQHHGGAAWATLAPDVRERATATLELGAARRKAIHSGSSSK